MIKKHSLKAGLLLLLLLVLPAIILAQAPSVKPLNYDDFDYLIRKAKGSVQFVCIYSSTCPACRKQLPIVNYVGKVFQTKGLTMLVLATDDSSQQCAAYLSGNELFFEPHWLSQKREGGLAGVLRQYGGNYRNAVPYTAVVDRAGKVISDWTGVKDYYVFADWIEKALESGKAKETTNQAPSKWEFSP
jgi:thiol-disulfide isomerase/thioredoxin